MYPGGDDKLANWLFPGIRTAILSRLMLDSREWHARDLARAVGLNHSGIARELRSMAEAGVVNKRVSGNRVYYAANPACPIYPELKMLIIKTAGLGSVLKAALVPLAGRIAAAYIYGSIASGGGRAHSDVDLMVVGDVTLMDVTEATAAAEQAIGREVNATVYRAEEYRAGLAQGEGFIHKVHHGPVVKIIGDPDELE